MSGSKILLTGASGVVGNELLKCLPLRDVLAAYHRSRPDDIYNAIALDIRLPRLGLDREDYTSLADSVTQIVHCAAITDMNPNLQGIEETNIIGVKNILQLACDTGAPLHYMSTAFCAPGYGSEYTEKSPYIVSKRDAEDLVQDSDIDWTISRPSIVVGHSQTGKINTFQGFHQFITSIVQGRLPFIPLNRDAFCDFVPADLVAKSVAKILDIGEPKKSYWLTAGQNAVFVDKMLEYSRPFASALGVDLETREIISPETIQSRFSEKLDKLPKGLRERLDMLVELANVMAVERPFPSDMNTLLSPDYVLEPDYLLDILGNNILYWGAMTNRPFKGMEKIYHHTGVMSVTC